MKVFVLRGIPGSGKTTWVDQQSDQLEAESFTICSADDSHRLSDGSYHFVQENAQAAHQYCLRCYLGLLGSRQAETIFVDNTNLHAWEAAPYVAAGMACGVDVEVVSFWPADPVDCACRNVHGVPPERVLAMYQTFLSERLPAHWKQRVIAGDCWCGK